MNKLQYTDGLWTFHPLTGRYASAGCFATGRFTPCKFCGRILHIISSVIS